MSTVVVLEEGSITADGTEQTVYEGRKRFVALINLTEMVGGDRVLLKQYMKVDESWIWYATEPYSDAQNSEGKEPLVYVTPKMGKDVKVTLQQTTGTYRTYPYQVLDEGRPVGSRSRWIQQQLGGD